MRTTAREVFGRVEGRELLGGGGVKGGEVVWLGLGLLVYGARDRGGEEEEEEEGVSCISSRVVPPCYFLVLLFFSRSSLFLSVFFFSSLFPWIPPVVQ